MTLPPPTERQARLIWLALTGLSLAVLAALGVALLWGLERVPVYAVRLGERIDFWINHPPPWLQRALEREAKPAGARPAPATTNGSVPAISTNSVAANSSVPAKKGLLGGALDQGTVQTAA